MYFDNSMEEFDRWYARSNVFPSKEAALERWKSFGLQGLPDYPHEYPMERIPGWKLNDEGLYLQGEFDRHFVRGNYSHDQAKELESKCWRLPTVSELLRMVDNTRTLPSTNLPYIKIGEMAWYATNDPEIVIDFGRVGMLCKVSPFHSRYVRLIER